MKRHPTHGDALMEDGDPCPKCGKGRLENTKTFHLKCNTCSHAIQKRCPCLYQASHCAGCNYVPECSKRLPASGPKEEVIDAIE